MTGVDDPAKYELAAEYLRLQIENGTIVAGQAVSATELSAQIQWPPRDCARVLRSLAEEGVLTRYPGLGYYVNDPARMEARRGGQGTLPGG
jgi:DNA-binding GntR family transcriptional regulator